MSTADAMFQPERKKDDPPKEIPRDRWQRPLIIPPGGGKPIPYIRASTLSSAIDDKEALGNWKARMTGRGVAISPDLQMGFASIPDMTSKEGKKTADELAEQAQERAGSSFKRVVGTAFHSLSEQIDSGDEPEHVPPQLELLLANYRKLMSAVRVLAIEQFVVVDEVQAAGTADRVNQRAGQLPRIWDIKSGRVDFPLKFAIQLAEYAHGKLYNPKDGRRVGWPSMDLQWGQILHTDAETGAVTLYKVNIEAGWEYAKLARAAYDARRDKSIMVPDDFIEVEERVERVEPAVHPTVPEGRYGAELKEYMFTKARGEAPPPSIMKRLSACTTLAELAAVHQETGHLWEAKHKTFANYMVEDIKKRAVMS